MYLQGYIAGVTDEMNDLANVGMDFDWPKTNGEVVDAVCQYFTLHPEQWSSDAASGVHLAATALYKKKGK
jgi:Ssp1 endopeptidase immunity protein Rap1a